MPLPLPPLQLPLYQIWKSSALNAKAAHISYRLRAINLSMLYYSVGQNVTEYIEEIIINTQAET